MNDIRFCRRCLYGTSHPLGLILDAAGVCSGCRVHEEKDRLDWDARWRALQDLVKPYRSRTKESYDCIIPVSGANDSYYIVHLAKHRLGLNPLLVNYNKYFNTDLGIRNLANLRIKFDCPILQQNVNPLSVRKITRASLRRSSSIYWPVLAGQTAFPVQTAVRFKIPLIIWGAHQGLEQVGMYSHEHEVEMTRRNRHDHDLMGIEADELPTLFDTLNEEDIQAYRYPDDASLDEIGVRGIYLGNYVRWDPKAQHEEMIDKYNYRTAAFARTFDCYDHVDCYNYMNLHDQLKLYKHGYSKVTDHATREIRHGRLTRAQGLALVKRYEAVKPKNLRRFCEWLGIEPSSLQFLLNLARDQRFWHETRPGSWSFHGWSEASGEAIGNAAINFTANDEFASFPDNRYIIVGKGYP